MALVVIVELVTENSSSKGPKIPLTLKSCPSNKIKVLLVMGSNGDPYFHEKETPKPFSSLTQQSPSLGIGQVKPSRHTETGQTQSQIPLLFCKHRVLNMMDE